MWVLVFLAIAIAVVAHLPAVRVRPSCPPSELGRRLAGAKQAVVAERRPAESEY